MMPPRSSKRLLTIIKTLSKAQKLDYYRVCGVADKKLTNGGLPGLNVQQCEMICERLSTNRDVTMAEVKALSSPHIAPVPRPAPPEAEPTFNFGDGESSSSSGPTST
jgi:hypothetical protein